MKLINLIFVFIIFLFSGCDVLDDIKPDKCDSTVLKPDYRITANSKLFFGKIIFNDAEYPTSKKANYQITYTKVRCGGNTTTYYSTPMYTANKSVSIEFEHTINNSTEYRNSVDYIIIELTCHLLNANNDILTSKVATDKYTYNDVDHAAHNGVVNIVPNFVIKF